MVLVCPRVWLIDLDALGDELLVIAAEHEVLSADEAAWQAGDGAARYRMATRVALRLLLAGAGAKRPFGQALRRTAGGKPELAPGEPAFSVSHAGHYALIVVAPGGAVGGDLETDRAVLITGARRALMLAAGDVLTAGAVAELDDNTRLLAGWTCIEAVAKALGSGVGRVLTEIGITAGGARALTPAQIADRTRALVAAARLQIVRLPMPADLHAAVAASDAGTIDPAVGGLDSAACRHLLRIGLAMPEQRR